MATENRDREPEASSSRRGASALRGVEEPFVLTALLSLVAATVWLWLRPELLLQYFYSAEHLAVTHLLTLGFITSIIMGVLVRLAPMSLHVAARSRRLARAQFVLHFVGAAGMIVHFALAEWSGMAWATLLVFGAGLVQLVNFSAVLRRARRADWVARFVAAALVSFVLAAALGALLGLAKGLDLAWPFLRAPFLSNLFAHAHLAGLGWVTAMILGFQWKLVPTTVGRPGSLPLRFWLYEASLAGLVGSWLVGAPTVAPFAAGIGLVAAWQAAGPLRAFWRGRAREWETIPLVFLVAVAALGLALSLGLPSLESPLRGRWQLAYGYVALYGWVVLTVLTVAYKLFPVWVWQERFQEDWGRRPVPGMKDLYDHRLRAASVLLVTAGVASVAAGIVAAAPVLLRLGLSAVLAGVLAFVANFVLMARWALLPLEYRPSAEDWERFREIFPEGAAGAGHRIE